jgi:hypothetical protein
MFKHETHLLSACREMPVDAASEMIAMSFLPSMNCCFSSRLTSFRATCRACSESDGETHDIEAYACQM